MILRRGALAMAVMLLGAQPAWPADDALVAAARKEGTVVWYTTLIVNQAVRPLVAAFAQKYPGIDVQYSRADSGPTALKILYEARAGKVQADIFDGINTLPPLRQAGLVAPFVPSSADRYPAELKDKDGYWTATNVYFLTQGINTTMVSAAQRPKTLQDLLDPRWKGTMAWSSTPPAGAPSFVGMVLDTMGEARGMDYLKTLSGQGMVNIDATPRSVLDKVIEGEYAMALNIFNNHAAISAAKGAPVDWLKLDPLIGLYNATGLLKDAPHPNAAKLFIDFLESEDGQHVVAAADYLPAMNGVAAKTPGLKPQDGGFIAHYLSLDEVADKVDGWTKIAKDLFQ